MLKPDDTHIAVGMVDGSLSVRRRQPKPSEAASSGSQTAEAGIYDLFMGGGSFALGSKGATSRPKVRGKGKQPPVGVLDEFRVEQRRQKRLREYDRLLKTFKYAAAFDAVLRKVSIIVFIGLCLNRLPLGRPPNHNVLLNF